MYKEALEMILDVEPEDDDDEEEEEDDEDISDDGILGGSQDEAGRKAELAFRRASDRRHLRMASDLSVIESSAELLYGLIHQRYITSRPGIQQMFEKYELQHFGQCPRVFCNGAKVLPVGTSDTPGQETVKLFCPSCMDVYTPPNSRFQSVDGAFFGTTFGCLFFMTFPDIDVKGTAAKNGVHAAQNEQTQAAVQEKSQQQGSINGVSAPNLAPGLGPGSMYEPRIYGFRVSERARSGPRMQWLRDRPADVAELDEATRFEESRVAVTAQADVEEIITEEDEEEEDVADAEMAEPLPDRQRVRKEPVSRRRKVNGIVGGSSPMNLNGVGAG
ncbi:casein kinase 2 regulatory subunit, partial [Coniosporium uncinatum]